ncbi:hypothetical protein CAPTEDRAFT_204375 [Capitella teleta]|uniref:K Homology domain-containing protein n=1 Tax=Capitella teleta TaxID=283909 RepID=R7TVF6_CAPTE|nr:hypothetical protein CAPTEDRAFT_204375 [Capitella teleta]|eukprot:ELT97853.1 hypothetical protein CAPTEDRAFT_204375 [Capitella teleta]
MIGKKAGGAAEEEEEEESTDQQVNRKRRIPGVFREEGAYGVFDLVNTKHEMDTMAEALRKVSLECGLKINRDKTHVMRIGGTGTIEIQGEEIQNTAKVKFLRSTITHPKKTEIKADE